MQTLGEGYTVPSVKWRRDIDIWFMAEVLPHAPLFRAYAKRLSKTHEEAEDLLQDAYARTLAADDYRQIQSGKAYVFRILHNLAASKARRARIVAIENIPDIDALGKADPAPDAYRHLEARQELARLEAAIRALPKQCRQVITLRKVYDLAPPEIAAQLKISVSTVQKHLTKGMRQIAQTLADTSAPQDQTRHAPWPKTIKADERK